MEKQTGLVKRVITFYISTSVGEKFLAKDVCDFKPLKGEDGYVVEELSEEKKED